MTELEIILKLQQASSKVFDYVMYFLTQLGDETFFLFIAIIIFWCIDKRFGYKFIVVFMFGQLLTGIFKHVFKRTRPYQNGARAIIAKSGGYSFPSGHSQAIANMSTQMVLYAAKSHKRCKVAAIILGATATAVVMLTRMYLGQHYLTDVIAGAALGFISAVIFSHLFELLGDKEERLMFLFVPISVLLAIFLCRQSEDAAKALGALCAFSVGYFLEKRYVGYCVKSTRFFKHAIKVLLGGAVIIALKEGIKPIGTALELQGVALFFFGFLRYFIIGFSGAFVAPLAFKTLKL